MLKFRSPGVSYMLFTMLFLSFFSWSRRGWQLKSKIPSSHPLLLVFLQGVKERLFGMHSSKSILMTRAVLVSLNMKLDLRCPGQYKAN